MVLHKKQFAQFSYNFYLFIIYNFTQKKLVSKFNFYLFIIYNSNHVICVKLTLICTLLNLKIY
jgi:hypothetical protein